MLISELDLASGSLGHNYMNNPKTKREKGEPAKVFITEKLYLDNGAWNMKKKIMSITCNGNKIPFRQLDEYGRFEIL